MSSIKSLSPSAAFGVRSSQGHGISAILSARFAANACDARFGTFLASDVWDSEIVMVELSRTVKCEILSNLRTLPEIGFLLDASSTVVQL